MAEPLRVEKAAGQLRLVGVIDEVTDLAFLRALSGTRVVLNLKGVRRINSFGVRAWMDAIRAAPAGVPIEFVEVAATIMDQATFVQGFFGRGRLVSFYLPLSCPQCDGEEERLVALEECKRLGQLPEVTCPDCRVTMRVGNGEAYEQFLSD